MPRTESVTDYTRSGRTVKLPQKFVQSEEKTNGRPKSKDRLSSKTTLPATDETQNVTQNSHEADSSDSSDSEDQEPIDISCKSAGVNSKATAGQSNTESTPTNSIPDAIANSTCQLCQQAIENMYMLKCERCSNEICAECQNMDKMCVQILKQCDASWFCSQCKQKALNAIHTDKEIEDRCDEYLKEMTNHMNTMESSIQEKTEKKI